jgi:hypothetical protein
MVTLCARQPTFILYGILPPSLLAFPLLEGHPRWAKCGRRTRPFCGRAFREHKTNMGVLPAALHAWTTAANVLTLIFLDRAST